MAAEREIKTTLAIDGEKAFKTSISDSTRSLKIMAAELKLNTAEFNLNGSSIDNLTKRREILSKEMDQQKEHIKALTQAVEDSTKRWGESDENTDKYRESLVKAKTALATMENELGANEKALVEFSDKTKDSEKRLESWRDTLKKAGETLDKGAEITKGALVAVGAFTVGLAAAGKKVLDLTKDTGKLADELLTTSAQTGISTEKLQEWKYAAQFIDTEVETMTGSMAKMIKQMGSAQGGSEKSAKSFEKLGVTITDTNGQLKDSETVFFDAIDALGKVGNETERDALAMEIFGKSAQDLNPLIKAGSGQLKELGVQAHDLGVVMSDDTIKAFGAFDDSMNVMNGTIQAIKNSFATAMLPSMQSVGTVVQELAGKFSEWLKSNGAQALIATLTDKISALAENIGNNLAPIMDSLIGAFDKIISAIGWAIDNFDTLAAAAGVLAVAFTGLKIAKLATDFAALATTLTNPVVSGMLLAAGAIGGVTYALGGAQRKLEEAYASMTPFRESVEALTPSLVNVNSLLSESGKTVSELDAAIRTSEEAITGILATALAENRALRQGELESIQTFNAQMLALQLEKLTLYRDQQLAELRKLQLEESTLTQENAAQRIANAEAAYAQSNAITEQAYTAQLAIIENTYRTMNQVGSDAYNTELTNAQAHYNTSLAENRTYVAESYSVATNAAVSWVEADRKKWIDLNETTGQATRQYSRAVNQMELDNEQAFLSMVVSTKQQGGVLSKDARDTAAAILAAYDNLPPRLEASGKWALLGLTKGMEAQIPALNTAATMTSDEIVETVKSELGINSPSKVMMGVGENVSRGLAAGVQGNEQWLKTQLSAWSGDVISWIKGVFGIQSPSSVMRDLVGLPVVQGMALGITNNARLVNDAMKQLMPNTGFTVDVTSRFNALSDYSAPRRAALAGTSAGISKEALTQAVYAGVKSAMREQGDTILQMNDREMGRYIRGTIT